MCISSTQRQTPFINTIITPAPLIVNTQKIQAFLPGFFLYSWDKPLDHVTRTHECR